MLRKERIVDGIQAIERLRTDRSEAAIEDALAVVPILRELLREEIANESVDR